MEQEVKVDIEGSRSKTKTLYIKTHHPEQVLWWQADWEAGTPARIEIGDIAIEFEDEINVFTPIKIEKK